MSDLGMSDLTLFNGHSNFSSEIGQVSTHSDRDFTIGTLKPPDGLGSYYQRNIRPLLGNFLMQLK